MNEIWAIILAAGESKRMGSPKMLLDFNGRKMIEMSISNVTGSKVDKTIVVLGAHRDEIMKEVGSLPVIFCNNVNYSDGMLSSVKCGLKCLPEQFKALAVFQGDQPFIDPLVTNLVIDAYRSSGKGIVIAACNGKRGHPLLLDFKYIKEIETLDPKVGLRELARKFPNDVMEVETGNRRIFRDFDTYDDYLNEIDQIN
jgi:molybdenum cofactor cytidylyltransferase